MGIATVRGAFKKFAGTVEANGEALTLSGTVEVASVDTGDENRDGHLLSPDFFDAAQFPQITFTSTGTERPPTVRSSSPVTSRSRARPGRSS